MCLFRRAAQRTSKTGRAKVLVTSVHVCEAFTGVLLCIPRANSKQLHQLRFRQSSSLRQPEMVSRNTPSVRHSSCYILALCTLQSQQRPILVVLVISHHTTSTTSMLCPSHDLGSQRWPQSPPRSSPATDRPRPRCEPASGLAT